MPAYKDSHGRWRYRFTYNGKRESGSAPKGNNTKKAAEALEKRLLEKLEQRSFTGEMPTVARFADQFLEHQRLHTKPLTYESNKSVVTEHIVPHIGRKLIEDVGTAELDLLKRTWSTAGAADTTINTRLGVVKRMLALAVDWNIISKVPKARNIKIADESPRWLNDEECGRLLEATRYYDAKGAPLHGAETRTKKRRSNALRWYTMVFVALRTGLRIGELRGLQWADVDLTRSQLHVRRTDPGRWDLEANAPKGNKERILPLTPDTRAELDAWKATLEKPRAGDWVFPGSEVNEAGRRRTRGEGTCSTAIGHIAKLSGLGDWEEITWHTLRHTYASQLVVRGVHLRVIQALLGHASIEQTEVYAHLAPNAVHHDAVRALDFAVVAPELETGAPSQTAAKALPGARRSRKDSA